MEDRREKESEGGEHCRRAESRRCEWIQKLLPTATLNASWQARSVVFRFCKVEDAVQFKAALSRDEEWEHCGIHHAADP